MTCCLAVLNVVPKIFPALQGSMKFPWSTEIFHHYRRKTFTHFNQWFKWCTIDQKTQSFYMWVRHNIKCMTANEGFKACLKTSHTKFVKSPQEKISCMFDIICWKQVYWIKLSGINCEGFCRQVICGTHLHLFEPWATRLLQQWILRRGRINGSTDPSTPNTRLDRPQVTFVKSSVWLGRESSPTYQLWLAVLNQLSCYCTLPALSVLSLCIYLLQGTFLRTARVDLSSEVLFLWNICLETLFKYLNLVNRMRLWKEDFSPISHCSVINVENTSVCRSPDSQLLRNFEPGNSWDQTLFE